MISNAFEADRQAVVDALASDAFQGTAFEDLTRLAAEVCGTPSAMISLIDGDTLRFRSRTGFAAERAPRGQSFCDAALTHGGAFLIEDASKDSRFAAHDNVVNEPMIRFYAGVPLEVDGKTVGILCALGPVPHSLPEEKVEELEFLARQVVATLAQRRVSGA